MFKCTKFAAVLALVGGLLLSGQAMAKGFTNLSFEGDYNTRHPTVIKVFQPFLDSAAKQFPGKLSFNYFGANEIFPEAQAMKVIADGRVDFACVRPSAFPGQMNLLSVVAIPGMCPNAIVGSLVTQELIDQFPEVRAELPKNSVPFVGWASASYQIHSIPAIKSAADLKGKKIIVWDATTLEFIKALGATPIRLPFTDTYMAMSKGMADGVLCPLAPVRSIKITEMAKHHLMLDLGVNTFVINAHKPLIESMPKDMHDWIMAQGGTKMALDCGLSLDNGAIADKKWMLEQGHEFHVLSSEARTAMLQPLTDKFAKMWRETECKGMDPALVDRVYKFAQERSKFHQQELAAGKYGEQFKN